MSPLAIQIMLHCYCSDVPWENMKMEIWCSPAASNARRMLEQGGLLDGDWRPTEAGRNFVDALCSVSNAICRNANAGVTISGGASVSTIP